MIIKSILETSYSGMYKVSPQEGPAFYIRQEYITLVKLDEILAGEEVSSEVYEEFLDAGLACVVELNAVSYLARAEQSRFGLTNKLVGKGFEKKYIKMSLDYLESNNYLNDKRYASAWLNTRKTNHYEGRTKLLAELQIRGISRDISQEAVNEFFTENDESSVCLKAYERFIKKGKEGGKLTAAMLNAGFSYKMFCSIQENF